MATVNVIRLRRVRAFSVIDFICFCPVMLVFLRFLKVFICMKVLKNGSVYLHGRNVAIRLIRAIM